jgi:hypothetical protein
MNLRLIVFTVVGSLILGFGMAGPAQTRPIGEGDFGSNAVVQDYEGLGPPFSSPGPVVLGGDTYTTDQIVRYKDFDPPAVPFPIVGQSGFRVANNTDLGFIDIVLGTAVDRAGAFVVGEAGFGGGWTVTVDFFDVSDVLLGSVLAADAVNISAFVGWEAEIGLIKRIRFTDTALNNSTLLVDNLTTEIVGPASFVVIDGCETGVPNQLVDDKHTISDLIQQCAAGTRNHGQFVSCVAHLTNGLKKAKMLSGQEKGAIMSCAGQAAIP